MSFGHALALPYLKPPATAVTPPPASGALSHTLLHIGLTTPAA